MSDRTVQNVWFGGAQFFGDAEFTGAQFSGDAGFSRAQFSSVVGFVGVEFSGVAQFDEARFVDDAWFSEARFSDRAQFDEARFSGSVQFREARFSGDARFRQARFSGPAWFDEARFSGPAQFGSVQFSDSAWFQGTRFSDNAWFDRGQFSGDARFARARFSGEARFDWARFSGDAAFMEAQFTATSRLGPIVCVDVDLSGAVFHVPVMLEIAAREVRCVRTRWESTATVRLRYARVDLGDAVLSAPVAVIAHPAPFRVPESFTPSGTPMDESLLSHGPDRVRVVSMRGVDAAHLVLTDIDLTECMFSGSFHLDQLRLEGRTVFALPPAGWRFHGLWLTRWTRRRTLAEEHQWRAQAADRHAGYADLLLSRRQWDPGPRYSDPGFIPDPEDVAALYRQLRKAFEDSKNEPGAADFYYGECEMRRHDRVGTAKGERRLLWGYWLLSGYGLRASRAFAWLLAAMSLTVLLLMGLGLPTHDPDPVTAGTLHGDKIGLSTSTPDPALHGTWAQRMNWARAERATRVVVNSVVFRSSGQNLTTAGTYIEMASRLLEPTLLALGALAVRGRIKR